MIRLVRIHVRSGRERVLGEYARASSAEKSKRFYERRYSPGQFVLELRVVLA